MKYFGNISFVEMESSKLITYSTNMCWTSQQQEAAAAAAAAPTTTV
jgi:hypothetical protein